MKDALETRGSVGSVPLTKLLRRHPHLKHIHIPLRDLGEAETTNLALDITPLELVGQLRVTRVDTEHIPILRLSKCIEERIECRTEFACNTGFASGSEIIVVPILLSGAILTQWACVSLYPCG